VDIDSFSDAAPEVQKEIIPDAATEPPTAVPSLLILKRRHLPNSVKSLSLLFIGLKILSQMLVWLKFVKLFPKVVILLLL
jgi:hypothetical protein